MTKKKKKTTKKKEPEKKEVRKKFCFHCPAETKGLLEKLSKKWKVTQSKVILLAVKAAAEGTVPSPEEEMF